MLCSRVKIIGINFVLLLGLLLGQQSYATSPIAPHRVVLGDTKYFKNWAIGCDNTLTCQAIAMQPVETGENESKGYLTLSYTRFGLGIGAPAITITGMDANVSDYRIYVDKRLIVSAALKGANDSITLSNKDSLRLSKAIANGNQMRVTDAAGKLLGRVSLNGSAAALRHIDSKLKRKGLPEPSIIATRIGKDATIPDTGSLVALAETTYCAKEREGVTEDTAYSLGNIDGTAKALALISCGNGAYNFSAIAFVGTQSADGKWKFEPAKFDYADADAAPVNTQKILTNVTWDAGKQNLNSYHKGRVIADCGKTDDFVWDGNMFRLTRAERMEKCQGAPVWITVWQARVNFIG